MREVLYQLCSSHVLLFPVIFRRALSSVSITVFQIFDGPYTDIYQPKRQLYVTHAILNLGKSHGLFPFSAPHTFHEPLTRLRNRPVDAKISGDIFNIPALGKWRG